MKLLITTAFLLMCASLVSAEIRAGETPASDMNKPGVEHIQCWQGGSKIVDQQNLGHISIGAITGGNGAAQYGQGTMVEGVVRQQKRLRILFLGETTCTIKEQAAS